MGSKASKTSSAEPFVVTLAEFDKIWPAEREAVSVDDARLLLRALVPLSVTGEEIKRGLLASVHTEHVTRQKVLETLNAMQGIDLSASMQLEEEQGEAQPDPARVVFLYEQQLETQDLLTKVSLTCTYLSMEGCVKVRCDESFFRGLDQLQLEELHLGSCHLEIDQLKRLGEFVREKKCLKALTVRNISLEGVVVPFLVDGVGESNIEELDVSGCGLTAAALVADMIKNNLSLRRLKIAENPFNRLQEICRAVYMSNITHLDMRNCTNFQGNKPYRPDMVRKEESEAWGLMLAAPFLKSLDLRENQFPASAELIKVLTFFKIPAACNSLILSVLQGLKQTSSLKIFKTCSVNLQEICEVLRTNWSLETVHLQGTHFWAKDGCYDIGENRTCVSIEGIGSCPKGSNLHILKERLEENYCCNVKVRKICLLLIAARKFQDSDLSIFPLDVVILIAKTIWRRRYLK
jgi:hypothetical protein